MTFLGTLLLSSLLVGCANGDPEEGKEVTDRFPKEKEFSSVDKRKKAFFGFLRPVVEKANDDVRKERKFVLRMLERKKKDNGIGGRDRKRLEVLAKKYRVPVARVTTEEGLKKLKRKVDIIPPELALVQAANESNWGRSRFAKQGNNLFGQWCFKKGCGIVPKRRSEGADHEVASYSSVSGSVREYIRNLNSHPAYSQLRAIREQMREQGKEPTAYALAGGLVKYSEKRGEYVNILRGMLKANRGLMSGQEPPA